MSTPSKFRLIVVLGMHRSGTSTIARALITMGVDLGSNLMLPLPVNPKGFWEDLDICLFNEEILSFLDSSWHHFAPITKLQLGKLRKSGYLNKARELLSTKLIHCKSSIFGFKDPRTAKLLPFWNEVFDPSIYRVSYIIAYRNPLSVSSSLHKRDSFEATKSYLLWLVHVIQSLIETNGLQRIILNYDDLLDNPRNNLIDVANKIDLKIIQHELDEYVTDFLTEDLRHTRYTSDNLRHDIDCPELVYKVCKLLEEISKGTRDINSYETIQVIENFNIELVKINSILELLDKKYNEEINLKELLHTRDIENKVILDKIKIIENNYSNLKFDLIQMSNQFELTNHKLLELSELNADINNELSNIKIENSILKQKNYQLSKILNSTQSSLIDSIEKLDG